MAKECKHHLGPNTGRACARAPTALFSLRHSRVHQEENFLTPNGYDTTSLHAELQIYMLGLTSL